MAKVNDDDVTYAYDFDDIPAWLRVALLILIAVTILSVGGCGTAMPVEQVKRQPPVADMVRPDPLPRQTDPSLGGIFKGYVNAAQKYRGCTDKLIELQDWINVDVGP
ncbi:hypothetical protein GALL_71320 [mine drainage metagenome]|uniref:Uncharacterized protein n=1 Tax=mine drainage metagenome TaxID=410659 RepID=A0A1J5SR39_9ZZZZ